MLCLLSLFLGVQKTWSCVLSKNIVHLVHAAKACCKHLAAGNAGCRCCCYLEEAGMNSLARGIHQFQVFIRFEAIGVSTGNRLTRSTEALFRMKNKCSALIISVSICFFFCFSLSVYLYLKRVTVFVTRRLVTPRQQSYLCRWRLWDHHLGEVCPSLYPHFLRNPKRNALHPLGLCTQSNHNRRIYQIDFKVKKEAILKKQPSTLQNKQ